MKTNKMMMITAAVLSALLLFGCSKTPEETGKKQDHERKAKFAEETTEPTPTPKAKKSGITIYAGDGDDEDLSDLLDDEFFDDDMIDSDLFDDDLLTGGTYTEYSDEPTELEGTWVLTKVENSDGTVIEGDELKEVNDVEWYEIKGNHVIYYAKLDGLKEPLKIDYTLEEIEDGRYNFNLVPGFAVYTVTVDGDTFTYEDNYESRPSMTFTRN